MGLFYLPCVVCRVHDSYREFDICEHCAKDPQKLCGSRERRADHYRRETMLLSRIRGIRKAWFEYWSYGRQWNSYDTAQIF